MMEDRRHTNAQIVVQNWEKGRKTNRIIVAGSF